MIEKDDWRLLSVDDDLKYKYINPTTGKEIGLHAPYLNHCAFCWTQVAHTRHQYWFVPEDLTCCICETCYRDFKELFQWGELDGWDIEWDKERIIVDKLERFYFSHKAHFDTALSEIRQSRKTRHWMWYIFPQLRGLGRSPISSSFGLIDLNEAKAFAADPLLGGNLRRITQALLDQPVRNANAIFGSTDAMKLRSCMTLFDLADPDCGLYDQVLKEFFGGTRDQRTLELLDQ